MAKPFILFLLITAAYNCRSQQLIQVVKDAYKLKENGQLFIDKPLKNLLNEIVPEIKMVFAEGNRAHSALSYFIFRFVDLEGYKKYNCAGKKPLGIRVMIKEPFEWNKSREDIIKWTKEDAEKFGNLTVVYISVYGEAYEGPILGYF